MDCPLCQGNGDLHQKECPPGINGDDLQTVHGDRLLPCPRCEGSGYLESEAG